ncbi:hypothetical protein OGATHE_001697 [Ogataea polymorpha]|uniref:Uncharacterized protein n=1 Tax=Ogataea polymorpha TaxID=460523 RepID=A0A9P8PPP7_9ASCO|nr:hypothetical protein OGATHE_001697 [Ogataea polymorpha]
MSKKPWNWASCRSIVIIWLAPAEVSRFAIKVPLWAIQERYPVGLAIEASLVRSVLSDEPVLTDRWLSTFLGLGSRTLTLDGSLGDCGTLSGTFDPLCWAPPGTPRLLA